MKNPWDDVANDIVNREEECQRLLGQCAERLNSVLVPWGFEFQHKTSGAGHRGPYATGCFRRGPLQIHLAHGSGWLGLVHYELETIVVRGYLRERITHTVMHPTYMRQVGHGSDCRLIERNMSSIARDGGDAVEALLWDLREYAAPTLRRECEEFVRIAERGYYGYQVLKN